MGTEVSEFVNPTVLLPLLLFLAAIFWHYRKPTVYDAFPRVKDRGYLSWVWGRPVQDRVWDGYQNIIKPSGKPFSVRWWAKDYLILPPQYLTALREAEWSHLSFFRNISDAFFLHTSVGDLYDSDFTVQVVKRGLNPRLPQTTSLMEDEIIYALEAEFGDKDEINATAQSFFTAIVHRASTRILIGEELCRDEKFIKVSTDFVMSIFVTALVIVKLPLGPFRDWFAYVFAIWHRVKLGRCVDMLLPVVRKRIQEYSHDDVAERVDAIEWSLMLSESEMDEQRFAQELMHNLWAGTSAPGGLVTDIIFQLLLEPHYKEALVKEAKEALGNGRWTETALSKLPLMDSFIREINRLYPTGSITCSRTVLQRPYTFSDGLTLPVGTRIGFPSKAMQEDSDLNFDGFRFAKGITTEKEDSNNVASRSATAMSTTNLAWGYGTHMCPGRHFAVRTVKMVIVTLLLNYEIQWDGEVHRKPDPTMIEGQFIPNLRQRVRVKRLTTQKQA